MVFCRSRLSVGGVWGVGQGHVEGGRLIWPTLGCGKTLPTRAHRVYIVCSINLFAMNATSRKKRPFPTGRGTSREPPNRKPSTINPQHPSSKPPAAARPTPPATASPTTSRNPTTPHHQQKTQTQHHTHESLPECVFSLMVLLARCFCVACTFSSGVRFFGRCVALSLCGGIL